MRNTLTELSRRLLCLSSRLYSTTPQQIHDTSTEWPTTAMPTIAASARLRAMILASECAFTDKLRNSAEHVRRLFDQDAYSDLTIKFGTADAPRSIRAHKMIMCEASDYFYKLCGPGSRFKVRLTRDVLL